MDMRKLDQLEQFAVFIDFLTKPEDYKKLLAELKQAGKDLREEDSNIRKTKEFQVWRNEQLALIDKREKEHQLAVVQLEKDYKEADAEYDKQSAQIDAAVAKVNADEAEVLAKLKALADVAKEQAELKKEKESFEEVKKDFKLRVDAFDEKARAFQALIKG